MSDETDRLIEPHYSLEEAAARFFPGGKITGRSLRTEIDKGHLSRKKIAGKLVTFPDSRRQMEDALADMHRQGLKLAIDDFGTGYSSLGKAEQDLGEGRSQNRPFLHPRPPRQRARPHTRRLHHPTRPHTRPRAARRKSRNRRTAPLPTQHDCHYGQGSSSAAPSPSTRSRHCTRTTNKSPATWHWVLTLTGATVFGL